MGERYEFDSVDFSPVVSVDEIVEALGADIGFQMSVDDFWNEENPYAIHCPEKWQSDIVRKYHNDLSGVLFRVPLQHVLPHFQ